MRGRLLGDEDDGGGFSDDEYGGARPSRGGSGSVVARLRAAADRVSLRYGKAALPVAAAAALLLLFLAVSALGGGGGEDDTEFLHHAMPPPAAAPNAAWLRRALQESLAQVKGHGPLGGEGRTPLAVVEEHHHALQYWFEAAKTGRMPPRGAKLVHVDPFGDTAPPSSRPDGHRSYPAPFPASTHDWNVAAHFANDEFVMAAVATGMIDEVVVVQPHWVQDTLLEAAGLEQGDGAAEAVFEVGRVRGMPWLVCVCERGQDMCDARAVVGKGRKAHHGAEAHHARERGGDEEFDELLHDVDDADDFVEADEDEDDEGHHDIEVLSTRCARDASVKVWNVRMRADGPPPGAARAFASVARGAKDGAPVLLDVDASFFDMTDATEQLSHAGFGDELQGGLSWVMSEVSCPAPGNAGAERREADAWMALLAEAGAGKDRASALYERLVKGAEPLVKGLSLCEHVSAETAGQLLAPLVKDMHKHLHRAQLQHVLAEYGPGCMQGPLLDSFHLCAGHGAALDHPAHPKQIAQEVEAFEKVLRQIRTPDLITLSRSVRDGNVRPRHAGLIEAHLRVAIDHAFADRPIDVVHDPRLLGGAEGWYRPEHAQGGEQPPSHH